MPFAAFLSGASAFFAFQYFPFLTSASLLAASIMLLRKRKAALVCLLALGVVYGALREEPPVADRAELDVEGVFVSSPSEAEDGGYSRDFGRDFYQDFRVYSARALSASVLSARALSANDAQSGRPEPGCPDTLRIYSGRQFEHGKRYRLMVRVRVPSGGLTPGGSSAPYADRVMAFEEIGASGIEALRAKVNSYMKGSFGPDSAAFLMAVTTGQRADMSYELMEAFNRTGLTHLLSISGTHFGIFSLLLYGFFRLLIGLLPYGALERLSVYASPKQAAAALSLPAMLFYLLMSGGSIPAVRSFVMVGLFLIGIMIGRKRYWLSGLLLAASLIVLWEPRAVLDMSFMLSFGAVLFIGFFTEARPLPPLAKYPLKALIVSLAATLGTAPLIAYYFHRASIISPASNLLITPVVGFVLVPFSLLSSFSYLVSGIFFMPSALGAATGLVLKAIKAASSLSYAEVRVPAFPAAIVVYYYACLAAYFLLKKRYIALLPFVLFVAYASFVWASPRALTAVFLSAGDGDSSIVRLPDGNTMVIDTGRTGRQTAAYLDYAGIRDIDALVVSHSHIDHAGGVGRLARRFRVGEIWDNGDVFYPSIADGIAKRSLKRGDFAGGEGYEVEVFHPYEGFYSSHGGDDKEKNNSSLVIRVKGAGSFLFAGDIEGEALEDVSALGGRLKSDVLKAPHHGLVSSLHEGFLDAVSPNIAVVTAKRLNQKVREALGASAIYLTGLDGSIKVTARKEGLAVSRHADFSLRKAGDIYAEMANLGLLFRVW